MQERCISHFLFTQRKCIIRGYKEMENAITPSLIVMYVRFFICQSVQYVLENCVTSLQVIKTIQYIKIWAYCHKVYEDLFERKIQYYSPSTNRESSNISQGRYLVISAFRKMTKEDFFYIFLVCLRFQQKIRSIIRFSMVLSL